MEQKFCEYCGSPVNDQMKFCTNCGAKNKFFVDQSVGNGDATVNNGYVTEENGPNTENVYNGAQFGAPQGMGGMPPIWMDPVQAPKKNTGLFVFSILNIIFGCCCGAGSLVGIAALIFTNLAPKRPTPKQIKNFNTIALVLNLVAVVVTVVSIISGWNTFITAFNEGLEAGLGNV